MLHKSSLMIAATLPDRIGRLNGEIQKLLCHARVFCVSEKHDNIVMWSHYADKHRGVVFKLRCIDEIDNTLLSARKVSYIDAFPVLPAAQYVRHLTGEQRIDTESLLWSFVLTKHLDWSYEKEWRVRNELLREPQGKGYAIYRENPRIFEAVYLGCRMKEKEIAAIVRLVRRHLPDAKIYRGEKSTTAFALSFAELNGI